VVLDLGTGDGRAVLRRARREPSDLFIGIDPDAAALRASSQRAARRQVKGGLGNALFLVGSAEELPGVLAGRVDRLTVVLPWGSLLRGVACAEPQMVAGLRDCLAAGGELELLLSVGPRDRSTGLRELDQASVSGLVEAYAACGLRPLEARLATADDVERLSSSWARRLGVPERRPAWLLRFQETVEPGAGAGASERPTTPVRAPFPG
jgi:16S rRNA (adenine(1408)-N(1))-methyltransferase